MPRVSGPKPVAGVVAPSVTGAFGGIDEKPDFFGGVNGARSLARDGCCCRRRGLYLNSDGQRLRLLGFGSGYHSLARCSCAEGGFQFGSDVINRATSCCDRVGLCRNPNSQRFRLLGFGNCLSHRSCHHRRMKVDPWAVSTRRTPSPYRYFDASCANPAQWGCDRPTGGAVGALGG